MNQNIINNYLNEEISKFINIKHDGWSSLEIVDKDIYLDKQKLKYNIWIDFVDNQKLLFFELRQEGLFTETVTSKAILSTNTGNKKLDENQLWVLGIS